MTHVIHWARENNTAVHLLKTVEMVFRWPNISDNLLPSVMSDVRRVAAAKKSTQVNNSRRILLFLIM